jgi:hypothetical protein
MMNNLLLIVSVALVAFIARNLLDTLRPFKQKLKSNDASQCKLYKGPTGAEVFVLTKNGWIISSSVDAGHLIDEGVDVCKRDTGGLWTFRCLECEARRHVSRLRDYRIQSRHVS